VEQNARSALALAHRAYVMESGEITLSGEARALLADPRVREAISARRRGSLALVRLVGGGGEGIGEESFSGSRHVCMKSRRAESTMIGTPQA